MKSGTLWVTGNPVADIRINTDPLALLIGMLLDQQIPIEWAFMGLIGWPNVSESKLTMISLRQ